MGAVAIPLSAADGVRVDVAADAIIGYCGISVRETAGVTASLRIREGGATGNILSTIYLAANDSIEAWYSPITKVCHGDLYEEHLTGTYEGSVFVV